MTKAKEMLELADKISHSIKTQGEITLFYGNGSIAAAALRLAAQAWEPVAWIARHPDRGLNFGTMAETEQGAASLLMRTGVAGNHGWSVIPLYAPPPSEREAPNDTEQKTQEKP